MCVHTVEIRDESDQVHSCLRKFSFALFTLRFVTVFLYSFLICPLYSRGFSHYLSIYFSFVFSYSLLLLYFQCPFCLFIQQMSYLFRFSYLYVLHFCNYIFHNLLSALDFLVSLSFALFLSKFLFPNRREHARACIAHRRRLSLLVSPPDLSLLEKLESLSPSFHRRERGERCRETEKYSPLGLIVCASSPF